MAETIQLVLVVIGVIAMVLNIIGLVRALLANEKFLSGSHKMVVNPLL